MIIEAWEVYKKGSQTCAVFKTKDQALNQTVFDEVDFISEAKVDLSEDEIEALNFGCPIICT
jgi:hypothetical protein